MKEANKAYTRMRQTINWASIGDGLGRWTRRPRGPLDGGLGGVGGRKGGNPESPLARLTKKRRSVQLFGASKSTYRYMRPAFNIELNYELIDFINNWFN